MEIKNESLRIDLKRDLKNPKNISELQKGTVGGNSIELQTNDPLSFHSYLYKNNKVARDEDFNTLENFINDAE